VTAHRIRTASAFVVAVLLFAGCQSKSSTTSENAPSASATEASNEQGTRSFMAGMARGDTTVVDSFVAENFVEHQQMPGMQPGPAGLKAMIVGWHAAFPDMQMTITDMAADSDKVWVHSTMSGTMKGPMMGMKPTGKTFQAEAFDLVRIENGKAVEHWGSMDNAGMMQQLGLSMPSGAGKAGAKH
jgi:predicted ester cyclase